MFQQLNLPSDIRETVEQAIRLSQCHESQILMTGSRVYGTYYLHDKLSDWDFAFEFVDQQSIQLAGERLHDYGWQYGVVRKPEYKNFKYSMRRNTVNAILLDSATFESFRMATEICKADLPKTREDAVRIFEKMKEFFCQETPTS